MPNHTAKLCDLVLGLYGRFVPYHPGRWRITTFLYPAAQSAWTAPRLIKRGGILFEADLLHDEVCRMAYTDNLFDPYNTRFVKTVVMPGMVCFDVGSNIGYYALLFSQLVGSTGKVVAFEPVDFTFAKMRRNVALNHATNIVALREAVGSAVGTISIAQERDNRSGTAHVSESGEQHVPVTTVDACVDRFQLTRLDFVKSDIEGYELHMLRGAEQSIHAFRPYIMVEISRENLARYGNTPEEVIDWLEAHGYDVFQAGWRRLRPLGNRYRLAPKGAFFNAIAVPRR